MSEQPEFTTLAEAKAWLVEQLHNGGAICPCCAMFAKVYKRKLNANMARALIVGYRTAGLDWFHAPTTVGDRGELAKLRYWGIVEEEKALRPDGGRAGWWRVTHPSGLLFVQGLASVPAHALIYDSHLLKLDETDGRLTISEALGDKFNYRELMAAQLPTNLEVARG